MLACLLVSLAGAAARAEDIVFETDFARPVVGEDGLARQVIDKKGGRNLLELPPLPFTAIVKARNVEDPGCQTGDSAWRKQNLRKLGRGAIGQADHNPAWGSIAPVGSRSPAPGGRRARQWN